MVSMVFAILLGYMVIGVFITGVWVWLDPRLDEFLVPLCVLWPFMVPIVLMIWGAMGVLEWMTKRFP